MTESTPGRSTESGPIGLWRATYTPGTWVVLSGPTSMVVLSPAPGRMSRLLNDMWDDVIASRSIDDLVQKLASFNVSAMPSFAAFFWGRGGLRSLVRGSIKVMDLATGDYVADGEGVQTWTEVGLGDLRQVRIDMTDSPEDALQLPLVVGAVTASAVVLDATDAARVTSPQQASTGTRSAGAVAAPPAAAAMPATVGFPAGDDEDDDIGGSVIVADAAALAAANPIGSMPTRLPPTQPLPPVQPPAQRAAEPEDVFDPADDEGRADDDRADDQVADDDNPSGLVAQAAPPAPIPPAPVPPAPPVVVPAAPRSASDPRLRGVDLTVDTDDAMPGDEPGDEFDAHPAGHPVRPAAGPGRSQGWSGAQQQGPGQQQRPPQQGQPPQPGQYPPGQGGPYGPPNQPGPPHQPPHQQPYGQPAYGPQQPPTYGQPPQYGQPPPPGQQGQPNQPRPNQSWGPPPQQQPPPQQGWQQAGQRPGPGGYGPPQNQPSASRPPAPMPSGSVPPPEDDADHDGATVFATSLARSHKAADGGNAGGEGLVLADLCVVQHPNPPGSSRCRICGGSIPPQGSRLVTRPVLAVLRPSQGQPVEVDRPVLIGRSPSADRVPRDQLPRLLTVPSPSHDISRTHVRVTPEGWALTAMDEYSTNGTILVRPGSEPERERLTPGEAIALLPGNILDLGDGITITVEIPS